MATVIGHGGDVTEAKPEVGLRASFEIARFQLRAAALSPEVGGRIEDAYAYAWDVGIYPVFHDLVEYHRPFAACFTIAREPLTELMVFFDEMWLEDRAPDFYELEQKIKGRFSKEWDRDMLIRALRYAWLSRRFDSRFYANLRRPGRHPTEAALVDEPFDRDYQITFP